MKSILLITLSTSLLVGCASQPQSTQSSRSNFAHLSLDSAQGDEKFRQQQAHALAGDPDAMVKVAQMYARGANGVSRNEQLMVQWLHSASELNHAGASYQLYLHYLGRGLDRDAVRYETLAVRQGFVIPPRQDPRRGLGGAYRSG